METIQTDTVGVELTLGKHLVEPLASCRSVLVDTRARRVVWTSKVSALCFDFRRCGGKVKDAVKAYVKKYGEANMVALQVRDGVVTSHCWTTQKATYVWDWKTNQQVTLKGGWKY